MRAVQGLLELLFPRKCVFCGRLLDREETDLCRGCRRDVPVFSPGRRSIPFVSAWTAAYCYEGLVRDSLLRFKFGGRESYAAAYGLSLIHIWCFSPYGSPGKFLGEERRLLFHMGVNMEPGLGNAGQAQAPEEWELTALRLMANVSRMEMLRAMAERPMSGQELDVYKRQGKSGSGQSVWLFAVRLWRWPQWPLR